METVDDETTEACIGFIRRQHDAGTPFFVWMNMTHMHVFTHTKPEESGAGGPLAVALPRHDDRP
jgi:arylsulfatase